MSVVCSSSNLAAFEELNYSLSTHVYALQLLDGVELGSLTDEFFRLLSERISMLSQTAYDFRVFETALRAEHDFNSSEPAEVEQPTPAGVGGTVEGS